LWLQDVLNDKSHYENNFLRQIHDSDLGDITVPFEYIKYQYSQMKYNDFKTLWDEI
jgi:hypothetical protein